MKKLIILQDLKNRIERLDDLNDQEHHLGLTEVLNDMYYEGELHALYRYLKQLEKDFERLDSTLHLIDMAMHNPQTSLSETYEKIIEIITQSYQEAEVEAEC